MLNQSTLNRLAKQEINSSLVLSDEITAQGRVIVIKKHNPEHQERFTKLGDVFDRLPSGLIHKKETGIGATTLELESKRNSIIVEPLKVTASSKAFKHNALYVGSPTKQFPNQTTKGAIIAYLNDASIQFKKIVVVAESFYKILNAIGDKVYQDFFFMIDEIDSFQLNTNFRKSMEYCLDMYKRFPKSNRAMVTATPLEFSDPILAAERITIIKYEDPNFRTIDIACVEDVRSAAVKQIIFLLKNYPKDKVLVAFNSVTGCLDIAHNVIKNYAIDTPDVKILCGKNSKNDVEGYYQELEKEQLPAILNFCTSAYFTGFDLSERYHLISLSSCQNKIHVLSYNRLKQIAGRCRPIEGLITDTIIYNLARTSEANEYSIEDCITAAKKEIRVLNYINYKYKDLRLLKSCILKVRDSVLELTTFLGYPFVRTNLNGKTVISYLNIDALMEEKSTLRELYKDINGLYHKLVATGHQVNIIDLSKEYEIEKNKTPRIGHIKEVDEIIELVKEPGHSFKSILKIAPEPLSDLQKEFADKYIDLKQYIEMDDLLPQMEATAKKRDIRAFKSLCYGAYYFSLDPLSHYKKLVNLRLTIGQEFSREKLFECWNLIFREADIFYKFRTVTQAVKWTKLHLTIVKKRNPSSFLIKNENPFGLSLVKNRSYLENFEEHIISILIKKTT